MGGGEGEEGGEGYTDEMVQFIPRKSNILTVSRGVCIMSLSVHAITDKI